ncbi:MAG: 6-phosphofructokinase [Clostridia bacterium]|nr:6-phosphofructokinase [Clostridia bacterium]
MEKILYGNAVVGQSGGPTAAINATLAGVIIGAKEAKKKGIINNLFGMRNGVEGLLDERLVNLSEEFEDDADIDTLIHTPAAALGSCRKKLPKAGENDAIYERLLEIFKKNDIRYFFYIGGNDSMDTVAKLGAYMEKNSYEMRIIGVPKTIDNDLDVTDHTPGYGSAAKYIATTVAEIVRDCAVYTVPAVTVVEIMGRDAGWLTAASSLAKFAGGAPDYIYLPEQSFDMNSFFADVRAALDRHPNVVIAISEGIRFADGTYVGASATKDVFGHNQLSGAGKILENALKQEIGCKVRSVELNISQRCASHIASKTDLDESVEVGKTAVEKAIDGISGHMMTILRKDSEEYQSFVSSSPVAEIANKVKSVFDNFINADGNYVTDECISYLRPLIMGEAYPSYENGVPKQYIIK